jgi:glucokinase
MSENKNEKLHLTNEEEIIRIKNINIDVSKLRLEIINNIENINMAILRIKIQRLNTMHTTISSNMFEEHIINLENEKKELQIELELLRK